MTYQALCYLLIIWVQITGLAKFFSESFSEKALGRLFGLVQFGMASALALSVEWWVQ